MSKETTDLGDEFIQGLLAEPEADSRDHAYTRHLLAKLKEDPGAYEFIQDMLTELGKDPNTYMRKFIKYLAQGHAAEFSRLGQALLKNPGYFLGEFKAELSTEVQKRFSGMLNAEKLVEIFCAIVEAELAACLDELDVPALDGYIFNSVSRSLVGIMGTHIYIYLIHNPCHDRVPLRELKDGRSVISVGKTSKSFRENMTLTTIHEVINTLGDQFLVAYASSYIRSDRVQSSFEKLLRRMSEEPRALGLQKSTPVSSLFQDVPRSFQSHTQRFRETLGARLAAMCQALDSLQLPDITIKRPQSQPVEESVAEQARDVPPGTSSLILHYREAITQSVFPMRVIGQDTDQESYALEGLGQPFVAPKLECHDYQSDQRIKTTLDEVGKWTEHLERRRYLLVAPPNGGKWRLQRELVARDIAPQSRLDLFVDLNHFSESGIPDIYLYVADQMITLGGTGRDELIDLRNSLHSQDKSRRILWHLENWDDVPAGRKAHLSVLLNPLSSCLLSTSDPARTRPMLRDLDGAIHISLFDEQQIDEFIRQYAELDDEANIARARQLAEQLPGLAMLPGGIEYICENTRNGTIIDLLFGFISKDQIEIGQPPIALENIVAGRGKRLVTLDWGSPYVQAVYSIVSARASRDKLSELAVKVTARNAEWVAGDKQEAARQWFDEAVRGRFLQTNDGDDTYRFIIPEVGYLLDAVCRYSAPYPINLRLAYLKFLKENSQQAEIALAFAAWNAEQSAMRSQSSAYA